MANLGSYLEMQRLRGVHARAVELAHDANAGVLDGRCVHGGTCSHRSEVVACALALARAIRIDLAAFKALARQTTAPPAREG